MGKLKQKFKRTINFIEASHTAIQKYYSRNHGRWTSTCHKICFVSVNGALMLEGTTYTNVVLLATLIWLGQALQWFSNFFCSCHCTPYYKGSWHTECLNWQYYGRVRDLCMQHEKDNYFATIILTPHYTLGSKVYSKQNYL